MVDSNKKEDELGLILIIVFQLELNTAGMKIDMNKFLSYLYKIVALWILHNEYVVIDQLKHNLR